MKRIFFLTLCVLLLVSCGETPAVTDPVANTTDAPVTDAPTTTEVVNLLKQTYIHSISELNAPSQLDDHASEYRGTALESNFREYLELDESVLGTNVPYYPRLKLLPDGRYILFYQNGNHGPDILYCFSDDGVTFTKPKTLFVHTDTMLFATADALVLQNGDLLVVASFREKSNYLTHENLSGLVVRRSSDNGKTWTAQKIIYRGCTWEPSLLQLTTGEVHVYWTNTTGLKTKEGTFTSTGTAILRSYDNGATWNNDPKVTYNGQIVSQSKTEVIAGVQMFSEQMPVAIQLHNGRIALALEVRLDRKSTYYATVSYSDDNWATALTPFVDEGPANKLNRFDRGAGPYIRQFVSGETVLTRNRNNYFTYIIGNANAESFGADRQPYKGLSTNYWAGIEMVDDHCLATVNEYRITKNDVTTSTIVSGRLYLNHRIDAKTLTVTADGDAKEWEDNLDAIFCGGSSQAQAAVRVANTANGIAFLCERLDYDVITAKDKILLYVSNDGKNYYTVTLNTEGVESIKSSDGTELGTNGVTFGCLVNTPEGEKDPQAGYCAELVIPRELLGNPTDGFKLNISVANADGNSKTIRAIPLGTELTKPSTWFDVKLK